MKLLDWKAVIRMDFPKCQPVTKQTIDAIMAEGHRFRGSMRVSTGRIWTDSEFEARRARVLATPLP